MDMIDGFEKKGWEGSGELFYNIFHLFIFIFKFFFFFLSFFNFWNLD